MRKIILLAHLSLDGFMATADGGLDFVKIDDESLSHIHPLIAPIKTALYGRTTYEMMRGYWPAVLANPKDQDAHALDHAKWVDGVEKVVLSRTMRDPGWRNARVAPDLDAVRALKAQPGGDIMLFASPSVAQALLAADLIDDWYLTINPVVLGRGLPLFAHVERRVNLALVSEKRFASGMVYVHYRTER